MRTKGLGYFKISKDPDMNQTRDFPPGGAVPQQSEVRMKQKIWTSKFCSQQMHILYFVFVRHFTSLPTCFDPCGSSSGHLIH
jgi:hypothetical protein